MVDKTLSYLDYIKLLNILKSYSSTHFADEMISGLLPLSDPSEVMEKQEKLGSVLEVIKWDGKIPLSDIPDIDDLSKRLSVRNTVLGSEDFILISHFLSACDDISSFLRKTHVRGPYTEEVLEALRPLHTVNSRIMKTINVEGFIEDTASYELSKIRSDLFSLRERIKKKFERIMDREAVRPVLQDTYIAIRNGRYVIPLKPNFNEALKGIVHDYSHSLKTSFTEPIECVELNNSINVLEEEEREEEKRVLSELTDFVRDSVGDLAINMHILRNLDFYHCLALFSLEFGCVRPEISVGGSLEIKQALNPFIVLSKRERAVPIDVIMGSDKKAMIISGPNAGGKTAALKTIGLLSVMAQAGLFIPAAGRPLVPIASHIFAVMGDEQDISMELSSFTAHMQTIKELFYRSKGDELVLIDEIGGGTEPQEASALSMSIIDGFVGKGCRVVVTTHLNLLKAYGYTKPFALNVATESDKDTMKPKYRLVYGIAGYSNAISVAKSLELPASIIEASYGYLGKQEHMLNDLVMALELGGKKIEEEQKKLARLREEAKKRLRLLKDNREKYLKKIEDQCESRMREVETEIEEIRRELEKKEKMATKTAKERLKTLKNRVDGKTPATAQATQNIQVDDYVRVRTLGTNGYVLKTDEEGMCEIQVGNIRTKVPMGQLERVAIERKVLSGKSVQIAAQPIAEAELNLIGMRVEEAMEELDRFIDRAILQGMPRVRILHGVGTGKLMTAVKKHLHGVDYVKLKRDEGNTNAGVTVVELP
ncbi:MAG: Smr/MutS family protein [Syntrophobacterales bacterium]|jgi:DNA mismatch repair protein MutS2|nr:Smr/MutS family protein [Syntrophobacterales bacterium]